MSTCLIDNNSPIGNELKRLTTNSVEKDNINSYCRVKGRTAYKTEFKKYVKDNYNTTVSKLEPKQMAQAMVDYYYKNKYHVNRNTRSVSSMFTAKYGYTSTKARNLGMQLLAGYLADIHADIKARRIDIKENRLNYYAKRLKLIWTNAMLDNIALRSGTNIDELRNEYIDAKDKAQWMKEHLDVANSTSDANRYAMFLELFCTDIDDEYFDKGAYNQQLLKALIIQNKELAGVYADVADNLDDIATAKKAEENLDSNNNVGEEGDESQGIITDYDMDDMIKLAESHGGHVTNYMNTISKEIQEYFFRLKRLSSPIVGNYDVNNEFELPTRMSWVACCNELVSGNIDYSSISAMIASIGRVAQQKPGFEAFAQFAEDLANDLSFASAVRLNFNKAKLVKVEATTEENNTDTRVSNRGSNIRQVMYSNLEKNIKTFTITSTFSTFSKNIIDLSNRLSSFSSKFETFLEKGYIRNWNFEKNQDEILNKRTPEQEEKDRKAGKKDVVYADDYINEEYEKLRNELLNYLQQLYPYFTKDVFESYIDKHNINEDVVEVLSRKIENLENLLNNINDTIDGIKQNNKKYSDDINNAIKKYGTDSEEYKALVNARSKDIELTKGQNEYINNLMNMLSDYAVVRVDNNSPNIHNNNQADVVNPNWVNHLTRMSNGFKRENGRLVNTELENWLRPYLDMPQYKYSPFLIEHNYVKGDGTVGVQRGLFRKTKNGWTLTDYADQMFRVYFYSGARNRDNGNVADYTELEEVDYFIQSLIFFNKGVDEYGRPMANASNYFLRTPSDAGNEYQMATPSYDCSSLIIDKDPKLANETRRNAAIAYLNVAKVGETLRQYRGLSHFLDAGDFSPLLNHLIEPSNFHDKLSIDDVVDLKQDVWVKNFDNIRIIPKTENDNANRTPKPGDIVEMLITTKEGYVSIIKGVYYHGGVHDHSKGIIKHATFDHLVGMKVVKRKNEKDEEVLDLSFSANNEDILEKAINAVIGVVSPQLEYKDIDINGQHFEKIEKVLDTKHQMAQVMFSRFKQEMLDAAIALDYYFNYITNEDGKLVIELDNDNVPLLKDKFYEWEEKEITDENGNKKIERVRKRDEKGNYITHLTGINHYHLEGNKLFDMVDGRAVLRGNVFHSIKFLVEGKDKDGNIIPKNALDDIIIRKDNEDRFIGTIPAVNSTTGEQTFNEQGNPLTRTVNNGIDFIYGVEDGSNLQIIRDDSGKVIDVDFTEGQEALIYNGIESFIKDSVEGLKEFAEPYQELLDVTGVNLNLIATSYVCNYWLFYETSDEILEGNPKFYNKLDKIASAVLKRAKQYQGSGLAYSVSNYDGDMMNRNVREEIDPEESYLNGGTIQQPVFDENGKRQYDENNKPITKNVLVSEALPGFLKGLRQYKGFRAVTVKNSKNGRNAQFNAIIDYLTKIFENSKDANGKNEYTPEEARERAMSIIYGSIKRDSKGRPLDENGKPIRKGSNVEPAREGGFTDTKVNDAQSYITLQEFVRRVAAKGQLPKYMPVLEKIMDENAVISAKDIEAFIQVQKNFYYDIYNDPDFGINRPRQIKNAEFVLIPRFIKGTQLEEVYNMMVAADIDQLNTIETSKASNAKVITLWNDDGNFDLWNKDGSRNEEKFNEYVTTFNSSAEPYFYENLYSQQETPQHMDKTNKLGIQVYKKTFDNIDENSPLWDAKQMFFELQCINIEQDRIDLCRELGIPLDENNNIDFSFADNGKIAGIWSIDENTPPERIRDIVASKQAMYERLFADQARTGINNNNKDYVTLDETNMPLMPATHNVSVTQENLIQSFSNNNISRQRMKGSHMAQVTNVGWKTIRETLEETSGYEGIDSNVKVQRDGKLRYHPIVDGQIQPYAQIKLPLSYLGIDRNSEHYKNMSEEEILEELEKKELLDIIGYRIPTEGKQSMCYFKIAGILDESQGSTIVVPDEWVAQTGSDFDIDSIYTIQYNVTTDKTGELNKIDYKDTDSLTMEDYIKYVVRELHDKHYSDKLKNKLSEALKKYKKELIAERIKKDKEITKEYQEIKAINEKIGTNILRLWDDAHKLAESKGYSGVDFYKEKARLAKSMFVDEDGALRQYINKQIDKAKAKNNDERVKQLTAINEKLNTIVNKYDDILDDYALFSKRVAEYKASDEYKAQKTNIAIQLAKEAGLISWEQAKEPKNIPLVNGRQARENKMLAMMLKVMKSPLSLEENLMRSNFDDIVAAREKYISKDFKNRRAAFSPYSIVTQMRMRTDAMAGRNLKALSVVLDTLCSVANTTKAEIAVSIPVIYSESDKVKYGWAKRAYGDSVKVVTNKKNKTKDVDTFIVQHDKYGWSENNKNVSDKIITAYSSQTTALALDTIKEGSIPNVNLYSFNVFKTLVNLGISFEASVPFMMQPAIGRIIRNNSTNKSIYNTNVKSNPIYKSIKEIGNALFKLHTGVDNYFETTSIADVMTEINAVFGKKFNKLFKYDNEINIDGDNFRTAKIPIKQQMIADRIDNKGVFKSSEEIRLLFDLGNIIIFNNTKAIADEIMKSARVSNPDKAGAKQTVFETRQILYSIQDILFKKELYTPDLEAREQYKEEKGIKSNYIISNDGKYYLRPKKQIFLAHNKKDKLVPFVEALYPGCSTNIKDGIEGMISEILNNHDVLESSYPPLYAQLRNATITSIILGSSVLDTESSSIYPIMEGFRDVMSGANPILDVETYKSLQKYFLTKIYQEAPFVSRQVHTRKDANGDIKFTYNVYTEGDPNLNLANEAEIELDRICGYNHTPDLAVLDEEKGRVEQFDCEDLDNPTEKEMQLFEQLSPAQKVYFIKQKAYDGGLFDFLNVSLQNTIRDGKKRENKQTLSYLNQQLDDNEIYALFDSIFFHNSPLIVSTALDLIKYAIVVDGFNFNKTSIVKALSNEALKSSNEEDGTIISSKGLGFGRYIRDQYARYEKTDDTEDRNELYERYLRSHPSFKGISNVVLTNNMMHRTKIQQLGMSGMYVVTKLSDDNSNELKERLTRLGITYEHELTNNYGFNRYVRLTRNNQSRLYKVVSVFAGERNELQKVYLYPFGDLADTETGRYSLDDRNNKTKVSYRDGETGNTKWTDIRIQTPETYEYLISLEPKSLEFALSDDVRTNQIIRDLQDTDTTGQFTPYQPRNEAFKIIPTVQFDLNAMADNDPTWNGIKNDIIDYYIDKDSGAIKDNVRPLYLHSLAIGHYIKTPGPQYGSEQSITLDDGTRLDVRIEKEDFNGGKGSRVKGYENSIGYQYLSPKGLNKDIDKIKNPTFREIVRQVKDYGGTRIDDLFVVKVNNNANAAAFAETLVSDTVDLAKNIYALNNDKASMEFTTDVDSLKHSDEKTLNIKDITEVEECNSRLNLSMGKWANAMRHNLVDDFDKFDSYTTTNDDGEEVLKLVSLDSPRTISIIKNDEQKELKFLRTINTIRKVIEVLTPYKQIILDETATSEERFALKEIQETLEKLEKLPIEKATDNYYDYLATYVSTNPLIRDHIIDIKDGYWRTQGNMWMFDDIAENGTPLVQTMLKTIMTDTEAKSQRGRINAKKFEKALEAFERKGVDIDKLFDERGDIVGNYNQELVDEFSKLKEAMVEIENDRTRGKYSVDWLRANLKYKQFIAAHFNQKAVPEYYERLNKAEEIALHAIPELFAKYSKLKARQIEILSTNKDELDDNLQRELTLVTNEMRSLTQYEYFIKNGTVYDRVPDNIKTEEDAKLYSTANAKILSDYLDKKASIEEEYFEKDPIFGFQEQLETNLRIIESYEAVNPNTGMMKMPISELNKIPRYVNAVKWVKQNAKFIWHDDLNPEDSDARSMDDEVSPLTRIKRGLMRLKYTRSGKPTNVSNYLKQLSEKKEIYDALGRLDATKLTKEELNDIRELTKIHHAAVFGIKSIRRLITGYTPDDTIYTSSFYEGLFYTGTVNRGNGVDDRALDVENTRFNQIVMRITDILQRYMNIHTQAFDLSTMIDDAKGLTAEEAEEKSETVAVIKELGKLFQELRKFKTPIFDVNDEADDSKLPDWVKEIKENVTWQSDAALHEFALKTKRFSQPIKDAIIKYLAFELDAEGNPKVNKKTGEVIPNRLLFSRMIVPDELKEKYIDKRMMEARKDAAQAYVYKLTPYYYDAMAQARQEGRYEEWYNENHLYNPITNTVEPLSCWTKSEPNHRFWSEQEKLKQYDPVTGAIKRVAPAEYVAKNKNLERKVRWNKANPNYKEESSFFNNYRKGTGYDNNVELSEAELEAREFIIKELQKTAKTNELIAYFNKNHAPKEMKAQPMSAKDKLKEVGKFVGVYGERNEEHAWNTEFGFGTNAHMKAPMISELGNELTKEWDDKLNKLEKPVKEEYATETEYTQALDDYEKRKKEYIEKRQEIRNSLLNRDWKNVISKYIQEISRYNAIIDNSHRLFFLYDEIRRMKMYNREHGLAGGNLKRNEMGYHMTEDEGLIKQIQVFMNRYLYNQWKEDDGKLNKIADSLQRFASANYMTFNLKGGIGNVTLGLQGIFGERMAGEYFKHWHLAQHEYFKGTTSYHHRSWNEMMGKGDRSYSKQDAIIKRFNVVDYDELLGKVHEKSLARVSEGLRNFTYSLQTKGEHYMQNTVLFAMLMSHKIVQVDDGEYTYMNDADYLRYKEAEILEEVMDENQHKAFMEWKEELKKKDPDELKDFAWWRKDVLMEFRLRHLDDKQNKEFNKKVKDAKKKHLEEFDKIENMYTQLTLGEDGDMAFVEGSDFAKIDGMLYRNSEVTIADHIISCMTERVRHTNNKIHGAYNKMGAAWIEHTWFGSLIMQYHKHFPIGLLKRYRVRGLYNEFRGTVEKGLLTSVRDLCAADWRKIKADRNLTDDEANAFRGLQYLFVDSLRFIGNIRATWRVLPDSEKANIKRNLGDLLGTVGALALLTLLWMGGGDDDEIQDSITFNLLVYELDRLASESFMYNPIGGLAEVKKLSSTPIAAQSVVSDAYNIILGLGNMLWAGLTGDDDFSFTYKSGRFSGQSKLLTYIKRRIPMYSAIHGIFDLVDANQYFKVGATATTLINPRKLAGY